MKTVKQTEWMVQVWEDGGWSDYWPVVIYGESRRKAVKRAGRVFQGEYKSQYNDRSLRWRIGRKLREHHVPVTPQTIPVVCRVCGGIDHTPSYHKTIGEKIQETGDRSRSSRRDR